MEELTAAMDTEKAQARIIEVDEDNKRLEKGFVKDQQ